MGADILREVVTMLEAAGYPAPAILASVIILAVVVAAGRYLHLHAPEAAPDLLEHPPAPPVPTANPRDPPELLP